MTTSYIPDTAFEFHTASQDPGQKLGAVCVLEVEDLSEQTYEQQIHSTICQMRPRLAWMIIEAVSPLKHSLPDLWNAEQPSEYPNSQWH